MLGNLRFAEARHCFRIAFAAVNPVILTRTWHESHGLTQSRFFRCLKLISAVNGLWISL
jgi:hypothetical protein